MFHLRNHSIDFEDIWYRVLVDIGPISLLLHMRLYKIRILTGFATMDVTQYMNMNVNEV